MRLLIIVTKAEEGGAQSHVLELIKFFRTRASLFLGVGTRGWLMDEAERYDIQTRYMPELVAKINPLREFAAIKQMRKVIQEIGPDVVHLHSSKAGVIGRISAALESVPTVFTAHGWPFAEGAPLAYKALGAISEHLLSFLPHQTITVSEADYHLAVRWGLSRKIRQGIHVVQNGVDDTDFRALPGKETARPKIISVGRMVPQKDHALLIEALERVPNSFEMEFVGDGPLRSQIEDEVSKLDCKESIHFCGLQHNVEERLSKSEIFCLSSKYEGLPIVILEAMRAGLPVIASDVGGVREAVLDGTSGYLVKRGDREGWVNALSSLLSNARLRSAFGAEGRRLYENRFTAYQMGQRTEAVYCAAMQSRSD